MGTLVENLCRLLLFGYVIFLVVTMIALVVSVKFLNADEERSTVRLCNMLRIGTVITLICGVSLIILCIGIAVIKGILLN